MIKAVAVTVISVQECIFYEFKAPSPKSGAKQITWAKLN